MENFIKEWMDISLMYFICICIEMYGLIVYCLDIKIILFL